MDKSVYSNYSLAIATVNFVRRVKKERPEFWAQIQAEAAAEEALRLQQEQEQNSESA